VSDLPTAPEPTGYGVRYTNLPIVAIVGRPNVGKSTLFNRLLHDRRAITDPTPGVTRDPIEVDCILPSGGRCTLVDTGGFKMDREGLDTLVVQRSLDSIARADLILLLVDVVELTREDESFIELLRPYTDKVVLVINKVDSPERMSKGWNHLSLGFKEAVWVSGEHGFNMDELTDLLERRLDFSKILVVPAQRDDIRIAIVGKPNTGKSTLINRLVGEDVAIVSPVAGTTRDVIASSFERNGRKFVVLDTAGIRRKGKVHENIEYYSVNRAIKSIEDSDVVFHLIDAKEGLSDQDKKIAGLAYDKGKAIIFVLNKWDEMPDGKKEVEDAKERVRYAFPVMSWAPIVPISALDGTGLDKLLSTAVSLYRQLSTRVETGRLNQALQSWLIDSPPPVGPKTHFKVRYMTQVSANPVKFVIFASRLQAVNETYVTYLRNRIRKDLGFDSIPVELELRGTKRRENLPDR
jgi:GTPase